MRGRSRLAAAGASGLTRVDMRAAGRREARNFSPHDPRLDHRLQLFTRLADVIDPHAGNFYEEARLHGVRVLPPAGCVLARRERPWAAARDLGIIVPDIVANVIDDQRAASIYHVLEIAPGIESVARGVDVVAPAISGRRVELLGRDLYLLRAPEYRCRASARDLSTDIVFGGEWAQDEFGDWHWVDADIDPARIVEHLEGPVADPAKTRGATPEDHLRARWRGKLRVTRESARPATSTHYSSRGRADGCGCGGDIAAVLEP